MNMIAQIINWYVEASMVEALIMSMLSNLSLNPTATNDINTSCIPQNIPYRRLVTFSKGLLISKRYSVIPYKNSNKVVKNINPFDNFMCNTHLRFHFS